MKIWLLKLRQFGRELLCKIGRHKPHSRNVFEPDKRARIVTAHHFKAWCVNCMTMLEDTSTYFDPVKGDFTHQVDHTTGEVVTAHDIDHADE